MANFYESKPMQWVKKAGEKVVSTFVVMIVTGKVTDFLISKKEGKK